MAKVAQSLAKLISQSKKKKTGPYDTRATVKRVEGNTVWVSIPGGVDETPINKTVNCSAGDKVQVRVSGGRAWITGNASAPPTDDKTANEAKTKAVVAEAAAIDAKETAEAVEGIAVEANETAQQADTKADNALSQVGQSITTDTLHYLATDQGSGVTINTPGWTTTAQSMDSTNRYLWTYHTYHKSSGQSINTQPVITGVYGQQGSDGDDGVSITAVQPQYYLSTSSSSATGGAWSTTLAYETGKYIWTRDRISYSNNTTGYSTAIYNEALTQACSTSEQALNIAEGVDEHFWYDNTGAHVTQVTQDEWNDSTDPHYHSGGNTLITSTGMAIRDGMAELATFGASGAQIGQNANGKSRTVIETSGMQIVQKVNGSDVQIANLGYGSGVDSGGGTSDAPYYDLGVRQSGSTIGNYSTAEGINATASAYCSHAEGYQTTSSGLQSHAEGAYTTASGNGGSHAEGSYSHATGSNSHSEGFQTTASGNVSHAEGGETTASGFRSHAEGAYTTASGDYSHAQNLSTIADQQSQTAIGKYNTSGNTNNLFAIGNGTSDNARSDALTVDWSGNVEMAGSVQSFFKTVDLSWTEPAINAHSYGTNATHTVPAADIPDGMTLVGIVGWTSGNYRIYPYVFHTNGANSISVTMANATAANSASTTVHAYLLYIKATSA